MILGFGKLEFSNICAKHSLNRFKKISKNRICMVTNLNFILNSMKPLIQKMCLGLHSLIVRNGQRILFCFTMSFISHQESCMQHFFWLIAMLCYKLHVCEIISSFLCVYSNLFTRPNSKCFLSITIMCFNTVIVSILLFSIDFPICIAWGLLICLYK